MKYFIIHVTTRYDGMEWGQKWLVKAESANEAIQIANKKDFTHDDGIEIQDIDDVWEVTKEQADIVASVKALYWLN